MRGVILCQILSGRLPYELDGLPLPERVRVIAERDPLPLGRVAPGCGGDLEVIAATALQKDKERRYDSAAALAADLRRFLAREPIAARPVSTLYQLRRFAVRNPAIMALGLVLALVLVAGGGARSGCTVGWAA